MTGNAAARHGSTVIESPSLNLRAADALAAVVVERDRLRAVGDEPLVEHVEQLEERHVGADVVDVVVLEAAPVVGAGLAPDAEVDVHRRRHYL